MRDRLDVLIDKENKMKKIAILLLVAAIAVLAGCKDAPAMDIGSDTETATAQDYATLEGYLGAFGHVRVLGDIDHILKDEKVDDEEGVTVQSMAAGSIAFSEDGKTLTIPLTLTKYDFDGHRNPEDPEPWLYTRIATGTLTLELSGTTKDGVFTADAYAVKGMDLTLDVAEVEGYAKLPLPVTEIESEEITGAFVGADGFKLTPVAVTVTDGKAAGIADVNSPKFGYATGAMTINERAGDISLI